MATLNLRNPNGYDGSPGTQYKQGIVRLATNAEATAGTATNVAVTPEQLNAVSTGANFASPPVLGFGSTTPRPVHATTLSALGTVTLNTSGAATTTIGTGGTGAVNIGNATGNTAVTGSLAASTTLTAGTGITATTGNIVASAGAITAGTTLTATLGNITATNGNIVRGTAGNKDIYTSVASTTTAGANSAGTVVLVGGTATIATSAVTAASQIRLYRQGIGATGAAALGIITRGTISAGVSFIINAVQAADATALQTTDVSVIGWEIVN